MLGSLPRSVLNRDTDPLPESADRKMPVPVATDGRFVRQAMMSRTATVTMLICIAREYR